jgi:hypothetical protein
MVITLSVFEVEFLNFPVYDYTKYEIINDIAFFSRWALLKNNGVVCLPLIILFWKSEL